jgi:hypothetical protein
MPDGDLATFATVRGSADQLREMVLLASAGYHDDVYCRVLGDEGAVQFLTQSNARQVMSYCSFTGVDVDGNAEAIIPTGLDADAKGYLDYLAIAEGSGTVEMTLRGAEADDADSEHPRLASHWSAEGALETTIRLPASRSDLDAVPWHFAERWTADNEYVSTAAYDDSGALDVPDDADIGEYTPPTVVETSAETVTSSIVEPAEFMAAVNYYPVIVADGGLSLNLQGADGDDAIAGDVAADRVEGPDVDRRFDEGFEELFGELSGPVRLSTAPSTPDGEVDPPLVVVQDDQSDRTIRHVIGAFAEE